MANLTNKRDLAANNKSDQDDNPRNNQVQITSSLRIQDEYITQVFEEYEGKKTKNPFTGSVGGKVEFHAPYHDCTIFF